MKYLKTLLIISVLYLTPILSYSQVISLEEVEETAKAFISYKNNEYNIKEIKASRSSNTLLFYRVDLNPIGYIIVSPSKDLNPVIAYSFENDIDINGPFYSLLKYDLKRLNYVQNLPEKIIKARNAEWEEIKEGKLSLRSPEQWPEDGYSPTGGWLQSNWTQSAPYNNMCPIDPVTSGRSYVGCPATAMAMILNFHETTNNTLFTDDDDYTHSYAGRNYNIDDDYTTIGFPSFVDLNKYLDTLNTHWLDETPLTNNDKAALSFACGVAAHQVYTSEGSGTFSVSQARDAYLRFGCTDIILYEEDNIDLFPDLIQNIKDTCPAHLALVDEGWTTGHNIVVDGYNTDNYFHVNFGWGGSNNGWYLLPDEMPYSLTVIEGIIVDILHDEIVSVPSAENYCQINIYPNPAKEYIKIDIPESDDYNIKAIEIYNNLGQCVYYLNIKTQYTINTTNLGGNGIYYLHLINKTGNSVETKKSSFKNSFIIYSYNFAAN